MFNTSTATKTMHTGSSQIIMTPIQECDLFTLYAAIDLGSYSKPFQNT